MLCIDLLVLFTVFLGNNNQLIWLRAKVSVTMATCTSVSTQSGESTYRICDELMILFGLGWMFYGSSINSDATRRGEGFCVSAGNVLVSWWQRGTQDVVFIYIFMCIYTNIYINIIFFPCLIWSFLILVFNKWCLKWLTFLPISLCWYQPISTNANICGCGINTLWLICIVCPAVCIDNESINNSTPKNKNKRASQK